MPTGNWSFLHEWVIYNYLLSRYSERTLRLKKIISDGELLGKTYWIKVESLQEIINSNFPDIRGIRLKGENTFRPAEVKFTTSLFNYHCDEKYLGKLKKFSQENGLLLVISHDYLPKNLLSFIPGIDVYEIELDDFITFCRENFARLLNKQIKAHSSTRVWLMYQGPNFNEGYDSIKPARKSLIWCPTENLTGFDLAKGDTVLFFKTNGVSTQVLQKKFKDEKIIDKKWILKEIYIAEVNSKIFSRSEYYQHKKYAASKRLWGIDPGGVDNWRWDRVFEFKKIKVINANNFMSELHFNKRSKNFVLKAWEAYCFGKSRELTLKEYRNLLEALI